MNQAGKSFKKYKYFFELLFISLNIALIHAVLTAPFFGNLCMMISLFKLPLLWFFRHPIATYTNTSREFSHFLLQLIMSKRIVQIQSISQDQILSGVKNQMLMLLSSKS